MAVQVPSSVAEFYSGPHYGVGHRRAVRELLHGYRAVETVVIGLDQTGVAVRLGFLEVRQHVVVSPAGDAGVTPTVVHEPVTPGVHHAGHRARAAQHLAARPRAYAAGGQARIVLRLGQVPPVQLGAHRRGRERRHRRGGRLLGAGLQQAHRPPGHLAQASRDHGTGHAAAHHHEVQLLRVLQAGREPGDGRAPATRVRDRALRPDHQVDERHEERQAAGAAA